MPDDVNSHEQHDPDAAMERFEEFARKVFSVSKDDLKPSAEPAEEPVEEAVVEEAEIVEDAD